MHTYKPHRVWEITGAETLVLLRATIRLKIIKGDIRNIPNEIFKNVNTVVHLAGALGVQTLVLGSKAPSWCHTVMNMPLYKSVEVMNEWTPATATKRIKEKLDGIVKLRSA